MVKLFHFKECRKVYFQESQIQPFAVLHFCAVSIWLQLFMHAEPKRGQFDGVNFKPTDAKLFQLMMLAEIDFASLQSLRMHLWNPPRHTHTHLNVPGMLFQPLQEFSATCQCLLAPMTRFPCQEQRRCTSSAPLHNLLTLVVSKCLAG